MCVIWDDAYSAKYKVTNGDRQGEIFSSYLFNVHVDELSDFFLNRDVGCNLNGHLIRPNHII